MVLGSMVYSPVRSFLTSPTPEPTESALGAEMLRRTGQSVNRRLQSKRMLMESRSYQSLVTTGTLVSEKCSTEQKGSRKRKWSDEEIGNNTNMCLSEAKKEQHLSSSQFNRKVCCTGRTKKSDENFVMAIRSVWSSEKVNKHFMSRLDATMDRTSFCNKVLDKIRRPENATGVEVSFVTTSSKETIWNVSSMEEDDSCWQQCRDDLLKRENDEGICEGVTANITPLGIPRAVAT